MIVVSDTSPISHLHQIGRLRLLKDLYREILVPPAVERELRSAVDLHSGMDQSLLRVALPRDIHRVTELLKILDQGESEAIVLAAEVGADLILIDEATGRDVAKQLGLRRTGLLGVLLEAKYFQIAAISHQRGSHFFVQYFVDAYESRIVAGYRSDGSTHSCSYGGR